MSLISSINITIDGSVDAQFTIADAGFYDYASELLSRVKTLAFGRHTFEMFQDRWPPRVTHKDTPDAQRRLAIGMTDIQKVVFSSSLQSTTWANSRIVNGIDVETIKAIKNDGGMLTFGSPQLVSTLAQMNLIDDYYFVIQPMLAGPGPIGTRLFEGMKLVQPHELKFVESIQLPGGMHVVHFNPKR